jgi:8-oxo-dGTP diphosphatase
MRCAGEASADVVEVAVGVLVAPDGRFLLAQRPKGKPMAGYWEFPGGKLEANEDVSAALGREFHEELGIELEQAHPWAVRQYRYAHAHVRLHFWRVFRWSGEPRGLEGQALRWEQIDNPLVEPWLPGALPLKRWLKLPSTYAVSQAAELGEKDFLGRLDRRLAQGDLKLLQLREKTLPKERFANLFREVVARARTHGVTLLVNSAHPEHYWHEADGVHATQATLLEWKTRPDVPWCAVSCHNADTLSQAGALGADFAVLGPVKKTPSHPDSMPLGWPGFAALAAVSPVPVYALGGVGRADLNWAITQGAHGIAAIRDAWGS